MVFISQVLLEQVNLAGLLKGEAGVMGKLDQEVHFVFAESTGTVRVAADDDDTDFFFHEMQGSRQQSWRLIEVTQFRLDAERVIIRWHFFWDQHRFPFFKQVDG